jgi:hypothetical protein
LSPDANATEAVVRGLPAGATAQLRVAAMRGGAVALSEVVTVTLP